MSSLALELKARGIKLVDPLEAAALKAKKAGVTFDDCKEDFDFDIAAEEEESSSTPKKKKATPSKQVLSPSATRTPIKKAAFPPLKSPVFNQVTPKMSSKKAAYSVDDLTTDFSASIIQGFQKEGLSTLQYGGHVDFGDGLSVPYLIGGWGEQVVDPNDEWSSITQKFTIIRLIPSQAFSLKSLELKWIDPQTLKLVVPWPSWFGKISNHVGFQEGEAKSRVFHAGHPALSSMQNNKQARVENPNVENKLKRIVDNGCFQFERPMKTGKKDTETAMIRIPITDKDINKLKGEALPEGEKVRVLQIILTEETPKKDDSKESPIRFNTSIRDGKLGKEPGGIRSEHLHLMNTSVNASAANASAANAFAAANAPAIIPIIPVNPFVVNAPAASLWNALTVAGASTSSLALAAAQVRLDPPIDYGPVEIDEDKEVHGEDDYMPPPDESGNKRSRTMTTRSNSKSNLVPPE